MQKMCRLFSEPVGRQIISLLVLITLEQVNTSVVGKKKESLLSEQNFDGEANWSGTIQKVNILDRR